MTRKLNGPSEDRNDSSQGKTWVGEQIVYFDGDNRWNVEEEWPFQRLQYYHHMVGMKKDKGQPLSGPWLMGSEFFLRCGWKNVIRGGSDCLVFKSDWPSSLQPVRMSLTLHPQRTHLHSEVAGTMFLHNTGCKYKTVLSQSGRLHYEQSLP